MMTKPLDWQFTNCQDSIDVMRERYSWNINPQTGEIHGYQLIEMKLMTSMKQTNLQAKMDIDLD